MKLISIFLMSFFILAACSQKKETFSLDCESQTQITVEGEAPYVLASKEKEDFIDNKYGVNKHSCPIWTDEKIECEYSSQDSSFKMTYDRKTGAYKKISSDVLFGKKRNFSTSGTCKVIPARTTTEMMQAPAQAPEPPPTKAPEPTKQWVSGDGLTESQWIARCQRHESAKQACAIAANLDQCMSIKLDWEKGLGNIYCQNGQPLWSLMGRR